MKLSRVCNILNSGRLVAFFKAAITILSCKPDVLIRHIFEIYNRYGPNKVISAHLGCNGLQAQKVSTKSGMEMVM